LNTAQSDPILQLAEERLHFSSVSLMPEERGLLGSLPCALPHILFDMDDQLLVPARSAFCLS
jgi:hypothetical protein